MISNDPKTHVAANDNGFAAATPATLLALHREARDAITRVDITVNGLLDGQFDLGRKAILAAYTFTVRCMDAPADAAKLPGWADAAVLSGTNPFGQPLKLLADDVNNIVQAKISMWAKVFRNAHQASIAPDQFLDHLKRNSGMRRWYDSIVAAESAANPKPANGGRKGGGKRNGGGKGSGKPTTASPAPKGTSTVVPMPVNVVQQVKACGQIALAFIDMKVLLCDADARAALESNPAYLGMVEAANDDCIGFVNDNDPRFSDEGADSDDESASNKEAA